jgi:hypothetical protein
MDIGMDMGMDMDCSIDMGMQHGDGHVACIRHVCIHICLVSFAIFASDHFCFVSIRFYHICFASIRFISYLFRFYSLLFAFYHICFASIRFLSYSIHILYFPIRFEANISESNPSIRYFA